MTSDTDAKEPEVHDKPAVHYDREASSWIYRASALASCTKMLTLFRAGYDGDESVPEDMARRFADGHLHEASIVAEIDAQRDGWTVQDVDPDTGRQHVAEMVLRKPDDGQSGIIIRGHTDGLAINPLANPDNRGVEAKSFSQANFDKAMKCLGDNRDNWQAFFDHPDYYYYKTQLTIYMSYFEVPWFYGIKNKNSGEVVVFDVPEPPGEMSEIVAKVLQVDEAGRANDVPGACDVSTFPCAFWREHDKYKDGGEAAEPSQWDPDQMWAESGWDGTVGGQVDADGKPVDDEAQAELILLCEDYRRGRQMEKDGKKLKDEAKRKIIERFLGGKGGDQDYSTAIRVPKFEVKWKRNSGKRINKDGLEDYLNEHGVDLGDFQTPWETYYPLITEKKS